MTRVCWIKAAKTFSMRLLLPMALFLSLTMSAFVAVGQTLNTRSLETPFTPQSDSRGYQTSSQSDGWVRFAPTGEEFTVLLPHHPRMKTEMGPEGVRRLYSVHNDGGIYLITSSPKKSADGATLNPLAGEYEQSFFKEIRKQGGQITVVWKKDLTLNGFNGREYLLSLGDTPCVTRIFVTKRRIYTLIWLYMVIADLPGPPHADRFLTSLTLGPINKETAAARARADTDRASIEPEVIAPGYGGIGTGVGHGVDNPVGGGGGGGAPFDGDYTRVFTIREVTQKARITSKPEPEYTEEARQNNINGTVVLRVILAASGQVTNILGVKGLPYGLTEKAIEAARRVHFTPAIKDGHIVSQYARLEYNFNLY